MRAFDEAIVARLNAACTGEHIYFIGLGALDFQLSFGDIQRIMTFERAAFSLRGVTYSWDRGPCDIPVWLLIDQVPVSFELTTPVALRMTLRSGDWVEFYSAEHEYEAAVIDFGMKDGVQVLEIY